MLGLPSERDSRGVANSSGRDGAPDPASLDSVRPSDLAAATRADLASGAARAARIATGVSGTDMARALGVSPAAVFYWETRQTTPTLEHALAYGRLLRQLARKAA